MSNLRKIALSVAMLALFAGGVSVSHAANEAATPLTKEQVEAIIHDYIMANPTVIMDSVNTYQDHTVKVKQAEAVKQNKDTIYSDAGTPFAGNEKGDVKMVVFFDYNCGYCKKSIPNILKIMDSDKNLKVLFKELPILGPTSEAAAKWALAAHKQGKYFLFHDALMNNHDRIDEALLEKIAKDVGLDVAKAKSDVQGTEVLIQIERNRSLAGAMSITGTPAFIVNDEVVPGAIDADQMRGIVSRHHDDAKKPTEDKKVEEKKPEEKKDEKKAN